MVALYFSRSSWPTSEESDVTGQITPFGTAPDGRPVDCRGVTILELGEDKVTGLRTYYDSAVFTRLPAEAVASTQPDR